MHKDELIDKFLRQELSPEELIIFKERWETNPDFVKEVRAYSKMTIALKAARKMERSENTWAKLVVLNFSQLVRKYPSIAAVALLAFLLPLYLLLQSQRKVITPDSPLITILAKKYFISENLAEIKAYRARNHDTLKVLKNVIEIINPREKIKQLDKIKIETGLSHSFILANLFFESNNIDSANYHYKKGLLDDSVNEIANWNLLMGKLMLGELVTVKKELKKMMKLDNSVYQQKAKKLLRELE